MNIKKHHCQNYILGLLLASFIILTGFEFITVQNELNSAEALISEKKYPQAEEILSSVMHKLEAIRSEENSNEQDQIAKNILLPQVYIKLGDLLYKQE